MTYGRIPLFPPGCGGAGSMHPHNDCLCRPERPREECQCVRIRNPACPDEVAEVELCVDCDGNLSICVHRQNRPCLQMPKRRCGCDHRSWFG